MVGGAAGNHLDPLYLRNLFVCHSQLLDDHMFVADSGTDGIPDRPGLLINFL